MESASFIGPAGKRLFIVTNKPEKARNSAVVMLHGFRGSHLGPQRQFVVLDRRLSALGIEVIRVDMPNSGNSDGEDVDISFNEWVTATRRLIRSLTERGNKVALFGVSMGASCAAVAASHFDSKSVPALVLWAPDPKVDNETATLSADQVYEEKGQLYRGRFFLEARASAVCNALGTFDGRVMTVYGDSDEVVPLASRKNVIATVHQLGGELLILKQSKHTHWRPEIQKEAHDATVRFILTTLCCTPALS